MAGKVMNSCTKVEGAPVDLNLDYLKLKLSIRIYPELTYNQEMILHQMAKAGTKAYALENGTICFIENRAFYITPDMRATRKLLVDNGFIKNDGFCIPIIKKRFHESEQDKWAYLRALADKAHKEDLISDAREYCRACGIKKVDPNVISQYCLQIPREGIMVQGASSEHCYLPLITLPCTDCWSLYKLGKYNYDVHQQIVIFVYEDGNTYVSRTCNILQTLKDAGYEQDKIPVPFFDGSQIMDPNLRALWESIL